MKNVLYKIYWNEYAKDSYLYGSEILFHAKDDVEFKNALMPPGTIIKRWYSKTNFQMSKIEPTLPMIDGEGKYHISLDVSKESKNKLLLKIVFYDRYDVEIETKIIRNLQDDFKCSLKTFSYEIQLINSGASDFHFHSMTITELVDGK